MLVLKFELQRFIIFFINIYVYVYAYTHTYIHTHTHIHIHSYRLICIDSHILQYNENLDAYLTSGSIKCIKKLHHLVVDPNTSEIIPFPFISTQ